MSKNLFLFFCGALFAGILQAHTVIEHIPNNAPDSRYTLHSDGSVTDNATGLMWQRCSLGQTWDGSTCTGGVSSYTWQGALQQGESDNFAGYSDWRLPNVAELRSIVAYNRHSPAINRTIFPSTGSSWYWSSSPAIHNSIYVWAVNFGDGYDGDSYRGYAAVRLVRGGQ